MKITFFGVQGGHPTKNASKKYPRGNTSSVLLELGSQLFIFDAGSGIHNINQALFEEKKETFLFLSHFHYDHVTAIPYLKQLFDSKHTVYFVHPNKKKCELAIKKLFQPEFFPVSYEQLPSPPNYISPDEIPLENGNIESIALNHPGNAFAYNIQHHGKSIIYATDNELTKENRSHFTKAFSNCDLLIHDSHFYNESRAKKKNWGHSFGQDVASLAISANIKELCIFHHNPSRTDEELDTLLKEIDDMIIKNKSSLKCTIAYEGLQISL